MADIKIRATDATECDIAFVTRADELGTYAAITTGDGSYEIGFDRGQADQLIILLRMWLRGEVE